jgi:AcrR family transcriptional regulator
VTDTAERRGRPRSPAVGIAVIETVLTLLEEGATIGELSIERIAREAGVGKATVYRRWSGKSALMLDVMKAVDEPNPVLEERSVRDDLVACVDSIRRRGLAKRSSAVLRNVLAQFQNDPELWCAYHDTIVVTRREQLDEVLRRGIRTGEIRDDLDLELVGDLFVGPMLARAMMQPNIPLEDGLSELMVDTVLAGVCPRP